MTDIISIILLLLTLVTLALVIFLIKIIKNSNTSGGLADRISDSISNISRSITEGFALNRDEFRKSLKENREELSQRSDALRLETESKLEKIRETMERSLKELREENTKKLDEMRQTVDEKLHHTLERRLSENFKLVSNLLEEVHKDMGEMRNLAVGVGDLKKVLSNVKTRGTLGEIRLGAILEEILAPGQYAVNIATKKGTQEKVEYAVKLPGGSSSKNKDSDVVYLPIDSKFPESSYHALLDAYDTGDLEKIKSASRLISDEIKRCARDIRDKYLNPPDTTDFGILFLPFEGLYAEVVRQTSLIETLRREYRIVITGPTTLAAFLNSLEMGFRTLAIEKRSSEVWRILAEVKTQFDKFGDVLEKAREKIRQADSEIENLVGTRTRQIQSKLKDLESLPPPDKE